MALRKQAAHPICAQDFAAVLHQNVVFYLRSDASVKPPPSNETDNWLPNANKRANEAYHRSANGKDSSAKAEQ